MVAHSSSLSRREIKAGGMGGCWLHHSHSQEAGSGGRLYAAHFFPLLRSRIPAQGMAPPTVGSSSHFNEPELRQPLKSMPSSLASLNLIKLAVESNRHI